MTIQTPKAFDFGEEEATPSPPVERAPAPKAFDFGETEVGDAAPKTTAPAASIVSPKVLSFDDMPTPEPALPAKAGPKSLFDSEDHPAVRDALARASSEHPAIFGHSEMELARLFRRLLPVKLALVTVWADEPLGAQTGVLRTAKDLVVRFSKLEVPDLLGAALESTKAPAVGALTRFFLGRGSTPAEFKPKLVDARKQLQEILSESETSADDLESSARNLSLYSVALTIVADIAGQAADPTLQDALHQRRVLLQQAIRQAEMSILQMAQMRQQAADLVGQVTSFLTVTLPAIEMAQTDSRA